MSEEVSKASELDHQETARFVVDVFHRLILHHGLWFAEVKHQMGMERALELLAEVGEKSLGLQLRHLGDLFGFAVKDGVPAPLLDMDTEKLVAVKDRLAKNWLANDGIWFQAVEKSGGMDEAKLSRVVGLSSSVPFDKTDPRNPINRRISIVVLSDAAERIDVEDQEAVAVDDAAVAAAMHDGGAVAQAALAE